jgi:hypothetical protein
MNWIKLVLMGVSIMLITTGCERTTSEEDSLRYLQQNIRCDEGHYGMCFCYAGVQFTNMSCDDAYTHGLKIRRK